MKLICLWLILALFTKPLVAGEYETWAAEFETAVHNGTLINFTNILDTQSLSELKALTAHSNSSIAIVLEATGEDQNEIKPGWTKTELYRHTDAKDSQISCPVNADVLLKGDDLIYSEGANHVQIPKE